MHAMVDYAFDNGADLDKDGSLDSDELTKLMEDGPPSQAQIKAKATQSPAEIISACDQNADEKLSKSEAHDCVDKYVTNPADNATMHAMIDYSFAAGADLNGDGSLDSSELTKLMEDGPPGSHAQIMTKATQSPAASASIINACDQNSDAKLS